MIRIVLFEDNAQLAEGLAFLLGTVDEYYVAGSFRNLANVETQIRALSPNIVLLDIGFPSGSGIDSIKTIKKVSKEIKVIMLTGLSDDVSVLAAIKAGADGYILKKTQPVKLLEYVKEACEGGAPVTPSVARLILQTFSSRDIPEDIAEDLTFREKEVLKLLVNGMSYKLVAADLNVAVDTVRSHIKNIYKKLEVNSKSEAVAKAIRNNLV